MAEASATVSGNAFPAFPRTAKTETFSGRTTMFNIRKRRAAAAAVVLAASTALVLTGCAGGSGDKPAATYDPDEKVTLNFTFWGNDVRADLYDKAFDAFNEEYPNITVQSSFLGFPEYWEKRQTEAA